MGMTNAEKQAAHRERQKQNNIELMNLRLEAESLREQVRQLRADAERRIPVCRRHKMQYACQECARANAYRAGEFEYDPA